MRGLSTYKNYFDDIETIKLISMGEGNTPLVRSRHIGPSLGLDNLYFKLENLNPTGSYKDRFAAMAVSGLKARGARLCLATSSGNTGASLAAYSALTGISCHIAVVDGAPGGKLQQMQAYGAQLWMVKNFGIDAELTNEVFHTLHHLGSEFNTEVQISAFHYSPFGMQGVQSIAYEIADELPETRHIFAPAGGGGLTLAVVRGYERWCKNHTSVQMPKIHCVQPEGNDTIAGNLREDKDNATAIACSTTSISGLQVPSVIDGTDTLLACRKHGGNGFVVSDPDIYQLQKQLAFSEGIYAEPAGAVSLAGLVKAQESSEVHSSDHIVCLVTGHGFKDLEATSRLIRDNEVRHIEHIKELKPMLDNVTK